MGLIMDDHEMGLHAEARRESFCLYDDFGRGFSIELEWRKLGELKFLVDQLADHAEEKGIVWRPK